MRQCLSRFSETWIDGQLPALLFLTSRVSVQSYSSCRIASCLTQKTHRTRAISFRSELPHRDKHKDSTGQVACLPVAREWQRSVNIRYPSSSQRHYAHFQSQNAILPMICNKFAASRNRPLHIRYSVTSRRSQPIIDNASHHHSIASTWCNSSIDGRLEENVRVGTHVQKDKDKSVRKVDEIKPPAKIEHQNLEGTKDTLYEFGNCQPQIIRSESHNIKDVSWLKNMSLSVRKDTGSHGHIVPTWYSYSRVTNQLIAKSHKLEHIVCMSLQAGASYIRRTRKQLVKCRIKCAPGSIPKDDDLNTSGLQNDHFMDLESPTRYSQLGVINYIVVEGYDIEYIVRKRLQVGAFYIRQTREQLVKCQIHHTPGSTRRYDKLITSGRRNHHVMDLESENEHKQSLSEPISLLVNNLDKIKSNEVMPGAIRRLHKRHMLRSGLGWDCSLPTRWAKILSLSIDLPIEELKKIAPKYTKGYKHEHWEIVIPWFLNYDILATLKLLYATASHEAQPVRCVANALKFVARQILNQKVVAEDPSIHSLYLDVLRITLVNHKNEFAKIISSHQYTMIFTVLARHFEADMIDMILRVDDTKLTLSPHSYLQLSYAMANKGRPTRALGLLREAKSAGASAATDAFVNVGRMILAQYKNDSDEIQNTSTFMSALMDLGLELDSTMYNILLRNTKNMKDFATTKEIYRTMCTGSTDPDEYTYAELLQMCRHSGDQTFFRELLLQLNGKHRDRINDFTASELLRCYYHLNSKDSYEQLIEMYAQYYDMSPIVKLELLPNDYRLNSTAVGHKLSPSSKVLNIILQARLRTLKRRTPDRVVPLYYLFRDLVEGGDADVIDVAATSTYNIFLKALGPLLFQDDLWIRILVDMNKLVDVGSSESEILQRQEATRMTKPDQYTWNTLLNAFARNHQMALAEELFVALRAAGFKPDHITWHSLLAGYAYAQDLEKCAAVLQELSIMDFSSNKYTIKALRYLENKAQLAALLNEGQNWQSRITSLASRHETLSDEEKKIHSDVRKVSKFI